MEITPKIVLVLVPIGLGLFFRWVRLFSDEDGALLRKFVVRFTVPIFVFFSLYEARPESISAILPMMVALVLMTAVLFAIGWAAAGLFKDPARRAAVHACVTFGNYGWVGLGVADAVLGAPGSQRVVYFILLWWPVFYGFGLTIGFIHAGRRKGGVPVRKAVAVAAPILVAMGLGLAANLRSVALPQLVSEVLRPFGDTTVPLILFSVGVMLDFSRLTGAVKPALLISAVTLLVGPLVGWALAALLARDAVSFGVIVLEGAMPVATMTPMLGENYDMDKDLVSTAIVLSTAISLVTIPVVASIVAG
ncbi:MAG: AEC family transporter [Candidatus Brocadiae bacterium]|nr:AEC family transporter [Candidatus Brocadiia bacterium]